MSFVTIPALSKLTYLSGCLAARSLIFNISWNVLVCSKGLSVAAVMVVLVTFMVLVYFLCLL